MTDQHRATPKQWEVVEICREEGKIPWPTAACLLELRARIEALEAAQPDKLDRLIELDRDDPAMAELRAASAEARPADLSPAAQAVLNAADSAFEQAGTTRQGIAAALRAAADQVVPHTAARTDRAANRRKVRAELLAIAAELDPI